MRRSYQYHSRKEMVQISNIAVGVGLAAGFTLLVLGGLSFTFFDHIIRSQIIKKVLLLNGTEAYSLWQEPPIPIYLQVWAWDLQNEEEVLTGGKPNVTQRGPYSYREHRKKVDVVYNGNGTVTYRQIKTYHFDRSMSIGPDSDTFTTVNIPYMTLVNGMKTKSGIVQKALSFLLNFVFPHEGVFLQRSVREVVWGYTDPILHRLKHTLGPRDGFDQDFVGVLEGKNATDDGLYTVFTGESNIEWLGVIDKYNGARLVDFWSSEEANMVNGTDGTIAPPFINESLIVRMFSTDICRSIYGTYHGKVKTLEDITLYRFTAPKAAMEAPSKNPANAGFCTPAGNCLGDGLLNISTCQIVDTFHLPVVASSPHFYEADLKYVNGVSNMHPNREEHATNIDIEPNTGFVMQVNKRLQINVYLQADSDFSKTKNLRTVVHPVIWINESAITDKANAQKLQRELFLPKQVLSIVKYVLVLLGTCMVLIICSIVVLRSMHKQQKQISILGGPKLNRAHDLPYDDDHTSTSGILRAPSADPLLTN